MVPLPSSGCSSRVVALMQIPDISLPSTPDPARGQAFAQLLNLVEALVAENQAHRAENQRLRDEIARLKGSSPKPDIPAPIPPADHSSEAERQTRTPRGKASKNPNLQITRDQPCTVDPATLPSGATRAGTTETIVQDLRLTPEVIRFVRDVWFVPSTGATITAPLPAGYDGEFGPHIQALTIALGYGANVSQPSLLTTYQDAGIAIGAGTIARSLGDHTGRWQKEAAAIQQAGLASGDWHASDQTATRVKGQNQTCHVLGNDQYTVYQTRPGGTRQDVLAVLWGQEPRFCLNDDALAWLSHAQVAGGVVARLREVLPWELSLTDADLTTRLIEAGIVLREAQHQQVWDALGIAAYHAQEGVPIVRQLLSDDASVYDLLTDEHILCWVHDGRHYAKLSPVVPRHQELLATFRKDYWDYYRKLAAYREAPSAEARDRLRTEFATLFGQRTGYDALDDRIAKTWANTDLLLGVLSHPEIPLHNNAMELAARRRVRKRDVSFGPQSDAGARAWDTFQTIIATAAKQGVRLYDYLLKRRTDPEITPSLADRIRERSRPAPSLDPA
jgi:Transposase IS66 family